MIVGAIKISHHLLPNECKDPWAFGPVCNVIEAVCILPQPVPHKGALSIWKISKDVLIQVQEQLSVAPVKNNNISDLYRPTPSDHHLQLLSTQLMADAAEWSHVIEAVEFEEEADFEEAAKIAEFAKAADLAETTEVSDGSGRALTPEPAEAAAQDAEEVALAAEERAKLAVQQSEAAEKAAVRVEDRAFLAAKWSEALAEVALEAAKAADSAAEVLDGSPLPMAASPLALMSAEAADSAEAAEVLDGSPPPMAASPLALCSAEAVEAAEVLDGSPPPMAASPLALKSAEAADSAEAAEVLDGSPPPVAASPLALCSDEAVEAAKVLDGSPPPVAALSASAELAVSSSDEVPPSSCDEVPDSLEVKMGNARAVEFTAREILTKHGLQWDTPLTLYCFARPDNSSMACIFVVLEDPAHTVPRWTMGNNVYTHLQIKRVDMRQHKFNVVGRVGFTMKIVYGWEVDMVKDVLISVPMSAAGPRINAFMGGTRGSTAETAITALVAHGRVCMLSEKARAGSLVDVGEDAVANAESEGGTSISPAPVAKQLLTRWHNTNVVHTRSVIFAHTPDIRLVWFNASAIQGTLEAPMLLSKLQDTSLRSNGLKRGRSESPASRSLSPGINPPREAKKMSRTERIQMEEEDAIKHEEEKRLERKRKASEKREAAEAEAEAKKQEEKAEEERLANVQAEFQRVADENAAKRVRESDDRIKLLEKQMATARRKAEEQLVTQPMMPMMP